MRIHLARTGIPDDQSCVPAFEALAASDKHETHQLVRSPDDAEAILFSECHLIPDWRLGPIREHPLVQHYPDRCFVYDERDRPWCALPGVYVSAPHAGFRPEFQRAWSYYTVEEPWTRLRLQEPPDLEPDLLFSFVASRSHSCRVPLFSLSHGRAEVQEVTGFVFWDSASQSYDERRSRFAELLYRSKFVLCPRGTGTSSIRLYETMAAGRVPVIISDDWEPPIGPSWGDFSIRWPQRDVEHLIGHLEEHEPRAAAMGLEARRAFDRWFAHDTMFHQIGEQLEALRTSTAATPFPRGGVRDREYFRSAARNSGARRRITVVRSQLAPTVRSFRSRVESWRQ